MQNEITEFLKHHEQTIEPLSIDYANRFWDMSIHGTEDNARALTESKERYLKVYSNREEFRRLKRWRQAIRDGASVEPLTERQIDLLHDSYVPYQIDESVLSDIVGRETAIENVFNTFRPDFDGSPATDNQLRDVLREETDPARRRQAWEASKQVGEAVAGDLIELVGIRNREAQKLGYSDFYGMHLELQELDETWLFELFDRLEDVSEGPFVALKEGLDRSLKQRSGIAGPEAHPWLYGDPFFQELPATGITETLDAIFKDRDIEQLTREHFRSIGLDVDDLIERADLYERDGKSQHAFCLDVDRGGDVRVLCNIRSDERWMSTMLHEFGHAAYDKYNDPALPFLLREPAHILTTEAIAMLNGRMTKTPSWLVPLAGLAPERAEAIADELFAGIRASMLIFVRWALTLVRFERELYRDPGQALNSLWWDLVERIQKVTPPANRDRPDWASKIHLTSSPVYYQNYVLGELMASQLLSYIQREIVDDGAFAGEEVGNYLVEHIFKPGSRQNWNTTLERATGEPLNPEHFIRQFQIA